MKNITYISASAGSGKTYTLTKTMAELLQQGKADPSQLILTTFTEKAANEFKERAKQRLYDGGMYQQGAMLDNALIGTIHSVASQLVKRYWFVLGLSPDIDIMPKEDNDVYRSQSMSKLATDVDVEFLHDFARKFKIVEVYNNRTTKRIDYNFWKKPLADIIGFTTNYGIRDYELSRQESKQFFEKLVNKALPALPTEADINLVLDAADTVVNNSRKSDRQTIRLGKIANFKRQFKQTTFKFYADLGTFLTKGDGDNLAKGEIKKISATLGYDLYSFAEPLCAVWQSQEVYDCVSQYIDLMFELAKRWREEFSKYKRKHSLLDFNDLEDNLLKLLEHEEYSREIAAEFRYVFVDEFQDCSPLQVKIFDRLSELVEHSWWVGDAKQAIYGFRGSDTMLTDAIVNIIESGDAEGCTLETLGTSYRSVPEVVDACNTVFTNVFKGMLASDKVKLDPHRQPMPGGRPLTLWNTSSNGLELGDYIANLIKSDIKPSDIAVLEHKHKALAEACRQLNDRGIAVNYPEKPISDSKVLTLLTSLLEVADNQTNNLAKARVAFLMQPGMGTEHLIEKILDGGDSAVKDAEGQSEATPDGGDSAGKEKDPFHFLDEVPLVKRLLEKRECLMHQSVGTLTQSLVLELNLYNEARVFADSAEVDDVLNLACAKAAEYEERSARMGLIPTVSGFVRYITDTYSKDPVKLPGNPDGVNLMTMHGSKGLQWKHVIVSSLDYNPADEKKCMKQDVFGTHYRRTAQPTAQSLYPEIYVTLLPFLYGAGNTNVPAPIDGIVANSQDFKEARAGKVEEAARLMYVAMTRAADQLILHVDTGKTYPLAWLSVINTPNKYGADNAGAPLYHPDLYFNENNLGQLGFVEDTVETPDPNSANDTQPAAEAQVLKRYPVTAKAVTDPRDHAPSKLVGCAQINGQHNMGVRIPTGNLGGKDESHLGNCIHQIFRMHEHGHPTLDEISTVIKRHDLSIALPSPDSIAHAWDNLLDELKRRHGTIVSHSHERAFVMRQQGKMYTGSIDLTVETEQGTVLVDYKCCPMGIGDILNTDGTHYPGKYGAQLKCYADALTAAGTPPVATYLYYPVAGLLAEL